MHLGTAAWWAPALAVALLVNWFGDSLDGTLARVRDRQRPRYGYYVDHVIDLAGTAALLAGMGASRLMEPAIAIPPSGMFRVYVRRGPIVVLVWLRLTRAGKRRGSDAAAAGAAGCYAASS